MDTKVGGQKIAAGDRLLMVYSSANRDERVFADPDRIESAANRTPRRLWRRRPALLPWGQPGPAQAKVMFEAILTRFDGLEVAADPDTLPRVYSNLIDGFAHLPIRWGGLN